eukprot:TRINITY_DN18327_c0_g1_i6.p3 TRINITY_DN18327_c0_g1~~TRINITY_DN18327_c0_g1_i6.p3  ORF type:complete len:129 (-),score=26.65 TRINITY_DN18327_c0_g1_i6:91-477(-)
MIPIIHTHAAPGTDARSQPDSSLAPDSRTRPMLAMSVICNRILDKLDAVELGRIVYNSHAAAFGTNGAERFRRFEREVCVDGMGFCDEVEHTPPWNKGILKPTAEPTESGVDEPGAKDQSTKQMRTEL